MVAALAEHGITAYTDLDTPPTWRVSTMDPETLDPQPITDPVHVAPMKPEGAVWSAPAVAGGTHPGDPVRTTWDEYTLSNAGYGTLAPHYQVTPGPGSVVVRVNGPQDMAALGARFPRNNTNQNDDEDWAGSRELVSFEAMVGAGVTAVWYQDGQKMGSAWYGWDVNSIAWLVPGSYQHATEQSPVLQPDRADYADDDQDWYDRYDDEYDVHDATGHGGNDFDPLSPDQQLAVLDAKLAAQDAEIARLKAQLQGASPAELTVPDRPVR